MQKPRDLAAPSRVLRGRNLRYWKKYIHPRLYFFHRRPTAADVISSVPAFLYALIKFNLAVCMFGNFSPGKAFFPHLTVSLIEFFKMYFINEYIRSRCTIPFPGRSSRRKYSSNKIVACEIIITRVQRGGFKFDTNLRCKWSINNFRNGINAPTVGASFVFLINAPKSGAKS